MAKNLYGDAPVSYDTITLDVPTKKTFETLKDKNRYLNKDSFWKYLHPAVASLAKFKNVNWEGSDASLVAKARKTTEVVLEKKSAATKEYIVDFFCLFYGGDSNVVQLADVMLPMRGYVLAKEIVRRGAICLAELPEKMSWPAYKPSYWGDNLDSKTWDRWTDSEVTSILSMMSRRISGSAPQYRTKSSYYIPNYPYILPDFTMISFVTGKECPKLTGTAIPDPKTEGFVGFNGDDLFGMVDTIQNLIISGVLQPGKTKIGVNAIKKFNSLVTLRQFPDNAKTVMSRSDYVAKSAFLCFGAPSSMKIPDKAVAEDKYLKEMYSNTQVSRQYMLSDIFSESVKNVQNEFFYVNSGAIQALGLSIVNTFIESDVYIPGEWVDIQDFCISVNHNLALKKYDYIYPDSYSERPEHIKDVNGMPLPVTEFKSHFHDRIQRAMIEGFAAIGGAELLFDADGEIRYLRLTEAGKWYMGISKEQPKAKVEVNLSDALEIDDQTGLILVKDQQYPYLNLLPEFADKMTDTRYCFSEKAFLKKCDSPDVLSAKIKRFKMFILPEPGHCIQTRIDKMVANCDLVRKTTGGSTYQLFDIDPKNSRLHNIIVEDKDIRKNTLRVEGCKLLVKTKFIPDFLDKLREAGYLTSISY